MSDYELQKVLERYKAGPTTGIFTDGSARPNPGPGGWGVVWVVDDKVQTQRWGYDPDTTNNRMELSALIEGFQFIKPGRTEPIDVYSDSELCVKTVNIWARTWASNGWKKKSGPIKNLELVQELYSLSLERPNVSLRWIGGHEGWRWNEYADVLSTTWTRESLPA